MEKKDKRELVERYEKEHFEVEQNFELGTWDVYKKPKRVKVDFSVLRVTQDRIGGDFYAVRFMIENWTSKEKIDVHYTERDFGWYSVSVSPLWRTSGATTYAAIPDPGPLRICGDAKDRWSTPVIFNRLQREKLQDLVKYLEEKLNGD